MAERIPLGRILLPEHNVTAGANVYVLVSLAYMYRSTTEDAPPITVRPHGDLYRITDGRHRYMASVIAGRDGVLANVED